MRLASKHPTVPLLLILAACGAQDDSADVSAGGDPSAPAGDRAGPAPVAPPTESDGASSPDSGEGTGGQEPAPGQLTAGDWDDNLNFEFFRRYLASFRSAYPWVPLLEVEERLLVRVVDDRGRPVPGAEVEIAQGGQRLLVAEAPTDGRLAFLPAVDGATSGAFEVTVRAGGETQTATAAESASELVVTLPGASVEGPTQADIAFVVDVTGSMGDELEYLKAEARYISEAISALHPEIDLRYGLIVYRDQGDEFVTRTFDFQGLEGFRGALLQQTSGGGGDYPEAMHLAMEAMGQLSWRGGPTTARVAFLLADAPPHREHFERFLRSAIGARATGIRIFPVAASGVGDEAEAGMRIAAMATGARYLFLTDDSGIGLPHAEPTIPCYQVQRLIDLMIRAIRSQIEGRWLPADPAQVIRTRGSVQDGVCTDEDGETYRL